MPTLAKLKDIDARQNKLLNALPESELELITKKLEAVSLLPGEVLCEAGDRISHAYFPTTSVISRLYPTEDGWTTQVGMAGRTGMIGIAIFMGAERVPYRIVVQSGGEALRMRSGVLQQEFSRGGHFQKMLLLYAEAVLIQSAQNAVCNRLHTLEQQHARWLLANDDQFDAPTLKATHEMIANTLGVRRESVTVTANALQDKGYIKYSRGKVAILNRKGLERQACECYRIISDEYDRLLGKYLSTNRNHPLKLDAKGR